jgi:hypothetical protein
MLRSRLVIRGGGASLTKWLRDRSGNLQTMQESAGLSAGQLLAAAPGESRLHCENA